MKNKKDVSETLNVKVRSIAFLIPVSERLIERKDHNLIKFCSLFYTVQYLDQSFPFIIRIYRIEC